MSALLLLLVQSCSIQQRSEDKPAPFLERLGTIYQGGFVSGLLAPVMEAVVHLALPQKGEGEGRNLFPKDWNRPDLA